MQGKRGFVRGEASYINPKNVDRSYSGQRSMRYAYIVDQVPIPVFYTDFFFSCLARTMVFLRQSAFRSGKGLNLVVESRCWGAKRLFHTTGAHNEALKIAFCGSDSFSKTSFKKVLEYQKSHKDAIASVDLITRLPKPKGRGRSNIEETEIQKYTNTLVDSNVTCFTPETDAEFMELAKQRGYNLVIAVSYGRLIPGDFLGILKYGGLNVHPSLLPCYRGAAPLHAALLNRDAYTGVSVQTLHPTKFDHGHVLYQTPEISIDATETLSSLTKKLAPLGADGLVSVLKAKLYEDSAKHSITGTKYKKSYTKKVTTESRRVDLAKDSVDFITAKYRVFGSVFLFHEFHIKKKRQPTDIVQKRVQLEGLEDVTESFAKGFPEIATGLQLGEYYLDIKTNLRLVFKASDGFLAASLIKMENYAACDAHQLQLSLNKRGIVSQQFM